MSSSPTDRNVADLVVPLGGGADPPGDAPPPKVKRLRAHTYRFVVIFSLVVLGLLSGYRYTVNTLANDWYLFQVARHTAWLLDLIGYRADLESTFEGGKGTQVRATLEAWSQGLDAATPEMMAATSDAPLTPWERYRHRILSSRRNHFIGETGPRVHFVLKPGPLLLSQELARDIARLQQEVAADPALQPLLKEKEDALARAKAAVDEAGKQADRKLLTGHSFIFVVIPECGAFEIMAIFLAAVAGFPTGWRKRFLGLLLGVPALYLVNILRLSCLAVIGAVAGSGEWFDFAHNYVWQAIYIIFVVGIWLAWVEYIVKRRRA